MQSVTKEELEERGEFKDPPKKNLSVRVVAYNTVKSLGDAICIKYKKSL